MLGMQALFLILVRMESTPSSKPSPKLHYPLLYLFHILIAFRGVPKNVNVIICVQGKSYTSFVGADSARGNLHIT